MIPICKPQASEQYKQVSLHKFRWIKEQRHKNFTVHLTPEIKSKWHPEYLKFSNFYTWVHKKINRETGNSQLQLYAISSNLQGIYPIDCFKLHQTLSDQ